MSSNQDQITDYRTDSAALYFALIFGSTAAFNRFLSDDAKNAISKDSTLLPSVPPTSERPLEVISRSLENSTMIFSFHAPLSHSLIVPNGMRNKWN